MFRRNSVEKRSTPTTRMPRNLLEQQYILTKRWNTEKYSLEIKEQKHRAYSWPLIGEFNKREGFEEKATSRNQKQRVTHCNSSATKRVHVVLGRVDYLSLVGLANESYLSYKQVEILIIKHDQKLSLDACPLSQKRGIRKHE